MLKPLAIDLFCGLGGWTSGLLAEGYDVIGFDIEAHALRRASLSRAVGHSGHADVAWLAVQGRGADCRVADKYVARDGGDPSAVSAKTGKPRIDRQTALMLISDVEKQLELRRTKQARECLKLLRKLIWEARA